MAWAQQSRSRMFYWVVFFSGVFVCFQATAVFANKPLANTGYILHIQMTPAICALDINQKKQRKCLEGYSLTIASLVPEDFDNNCITDSSASLPPLQAKVVARVIPDEAYRVQLWRTIGGCTQMTASQYFRTIINYAQNLKIPTVLTDTTSNNVQKTALEGQFFALNKGLAERSVILSCQKEGRTAYLTHVSICYKSNGQFKSCPTTMVSNCPNNIMVQGTY
ncbi:ribonuclease T2 family protein [Acinetobacter rathckeae]|uniref:ribonuclease T2 family protein n=1 Tax=Acinetobacter rathckeae TaxID=2605272 RepID=UPI0018A309C5|nr:ribonuclease I [Acinetobacter rathckeae]MBF7688522.1 ribonuclease I [Acinetobacter rathckeae]MBF7695606.1 ribonuclease I [Acinetobacter rathckeae]